MDPFSWAPFVAEHDYNSVAKQTQDVVTLISIFVDNSILIR